MARPSIPRPFDEVRDDTVPARCRTVGRRGRGSGPGPGTVEAAWATSGGAPTARLAVESGRIDPRYHPERAQEVGRPGEGWWASSRTGGVWMR
jgi:hypothetical protein